MPPSELFLGSWLGEGDSKVPGYEGIYPFFSVVPEPDGDTGPLQMGKLRPSEGQGVGEA